MGVVLLLMTIVGFFLALILLVYAFLTNKNWLKSFVLGGIIIWFAGYASLLLITSLFSEEKTLALNEPKQFCGIYFDCHLRAAVTHVRKTKRFVNQTAKGEFYIISVRISSDAERAQLKLDAPKFEVVDARGKRFRRWVDLTVSGDPFEDKIPAGGAFEATVIFDLPIDVENPRLDISEGAGLDKAIESILIGDEDSILHKRNYFKLESKIQMADAN